ncbi:hypothetical protein TrVE_jg7219 [Triparma verrucosa]|uniref:RanBP2-type domain-containing protein n=1 Tax=Triparma verrucosa TaxID=1606542 RepID=A0A9W7F1G2_9STRA|nr:hypothetical protein TrVE_jg7219 [Triparma verrucosa]
MKAAQPKILPWVCPQSQCNRFNGSGVNTCRDCDLAWSPDTPPPLLGKPPKESCHRFWRTGECNDARCVLKHIAFPAVDPSINPWTCPECNGFNDSGAKICGKCKLAWNPDIPPPTLSNPPNGICYRYWKTGDCTHKKCAHNHIECPAPTADSGANGPPRPAGCGTAPPGVCFKFWRGEECFVQNCKFIHVRKGEALPPQLEQKQKTLHYTKPDNGIPSWTCNKCGKYNFAGNAKCYVTTCQNPFQFHGNGPRNGSKNSMETTNLKFQEIPNKDAPLPRPFPASSNINVEKPKIEKPKIERVWDPVVGLFVTKRGADNIPKWVCPRCNTVNFEGKAICFNNQCNFAYASIKADFDAKAKDTLDPFLVQREKQQKAAFAKLKTQYNPEYDEETNKQLDIWVMAKRARDYKIADEIEALLLARGINPRQARPSDKDIAKMNSYGSSTANINSYGPSTAKMASTAKMEDSYYGPSTAKKEPPMRQPPVTTSTQRRDWDPKTGQFMTTAISAMMANTTTMTSTTNAVNTTRTTSMAKKEPEKINGPSWTCIVCKIQHPLERELCSRCRRRKPAQYVPPAPGNASQTANTKAKPAMRPPPGYENTELRKPEIDLDLDPFDIYNADNADTTLGSPNSSDSMTQRNELPSPPKSYSPTQHPPSNPFLGSGLALGLEDPPSNDPPPTYSRLGLTSRECALCKKDLPKDKFSSTQFKRAQYSMCLACCEIRKQNKGNPEFQRGGKYYIPGNKSFRNDRRQVAARSLPRRPDGSLPKFNDPDVRAIAKEIGEKEKKKVLEAEDKARNLSTQMAADVLDDL